MTTSTLPSVSAPGLIRNNIAIFNPADKEYASSEVSINYRVDYDEDIAIISCTVETGPTIIVIPHWLRIRKFEARARRIKNLYMLLYTHGSDDFGLETSLFIEKTISQIMTREKMRLQ